MNLNQKMIEKTEEFIKNKFSNSQYLKDHPSDREYRLQHSFRVANIGKLIAVKEGFDVTEMAIACLLHDVAYCNDFNTEDEWLEHGRNSAKIARPFLESLGLAQERIQNICYGIAIHVDDKADFEGEHTAFALSVGDADNIDRFDVYRIYESLQYVKFSEMSLDDKKEKVNSTLLKLNDYHKKRLGTNTATEMWKQKIEFRFLFYEKLKEQLYNSVSII
ncbi:MAG TPA: HD domain-containing protein [Lachnospiraceae bacterium]|nr:HD domain-containing protein [Lachnospiraceae bacterium]